MLYMFYRMIALTVLAIIPAFIHAESGNVIHEKGDYYVVDTTSGYSVIEWYGGVIPAEGDRILGDLNSYGFKDVYVAHRGESQVWIEDFMLDEDGAIEKIYELGG